MVWKCNYFEKQAAIAKAIAHPVRVAVVEFIKDGEQCVCDIADAVCTERSNLSKHLSIMVVAELPAGKPALRQGSNMNKIELKQIGIIHTPFVEAAGTPIQPVTGKGVKGWVELDAAYADGLKDMDGFERIWLLFWCDRAGDFKLHVKPYMDTQTRGLFSTRAPSRPNPIGMSCVKLMSIDGNRLEIEDVDMLDGTPLLDIKPYVAKFDTFDVQRNGWTDTVTGENTEADDRFLKEDQT